MGEIHSDSKKVYGIPRIAAKLAEKGIQASRPRVARIMRKAGIQSVIPKEMGKNNRLKSCASCGNKCSQQRFFGYRARRKMGLGPYLHTHRCWMGLPDNGYRPCG
ncbi:IS3 family transposase [Pedobacter sp. Leaf132]|uniref:IS3 family transposase n=1 Tax=Pedobacter sp. Leaf132 TaxID=2876557 RepID=UPI00351D2A31